MKRRTLQLESAKAAVIAGDPDARRLSLAVARDSGFGAATRAKSAFSALAPWAARRMLTRRTWLVSGGVRSPH